MSAEVFFPVSAPSAATPGSASSIAAAAVEPEKHSEDAPVFEDTLNADVVLLEDEAPIQILWVVEFLNTETHTQFFS